MAPSRVASAVASTERHCTRRREDGGNLKPRSHSCQALPVQLPLSGVVCVSIITPLLSMHAYQFNLARRFCVRVTRQMLAFTLSSFESMPWSGQSLMAPLVKTLGVVSALDVGAQAELAFFASALTWLVALASVAGVVAMKYTRDRYSGLFIVKVTKLRLAHLQCSNSRARN
jgi:hypothetical protein